MPRPSFFLFSTGLFGMGISLYYLFLNKESRKKWTSGSKSIVYFFFIISTLVVIWGLISLIVTGGLD